MSPARKPNLKKHLLADRVLSKLFTIDLFKGQNALLVGISVQRVFKFRESYLYDFIVSIPSGELENIIRLYWPEAWFFREGNKTGVRLEAESLLVFHHFDSQAVAEEQAIEEFYRPYIWEGAHIAVGLSGKNIGKLFCSTTAFEQLKTGGIDENVSSREHTTGVEALLYCLYGAETTNEPDLDFYKKINEFSPEIEEMPAWYKSAVLLHILTNEKPSKGLKALFATSLLTVIFPEVAGLAGVEQVNEHSHKDVFLHTCIVVDNLSACSNNVWLRFAALVHDIAKPQTKRFIEGIGWSYHGHEELGAKLMGGIFRKMKLPRERIDYIRLLIRLHLRPSVLAGEEVTDSAIRRLITESGNYLNDLIMLCRADITSKNLSRVSRFMKNYDYVEKRIIEVKEKDERAAFHSPVRGEEIMVICNIPPSRQVGILKEAIEAAILEGKISNTYEAAKEYLLKIKDSYK
ncbi:MAG: HD domain-containing protein [Ignavibacteria bacterium]|nr:HD domain-containing protein [Ignavibacteria bacterium]